VEPRRKRVSGRELLKEMNPLGTLSQLREVISDKKSMEEGPSFHQPREEKSSAGNGCAKFVTQNLIASKMCGGKNGGKAGRQIFVHKGEVVRGLKEERDLSIRGKTSSSTERGLSLTSATS